LLLMSIVCGGKLRNGNHLGLWAENPGLGIGGWRLSSAEFQ
jgi:hypothetical protein